MGLRDAFFRLLSRGEADPPDPDAWCELITVREHEAPLLLQRLEVLDIEARQQESLDVASRTLSKVTVLVRRSDLQSAQAATES